ncbi:cupin domain-containing protein [Thermofilum pendens]|uniref:Cupin domain-containing protein n=1 Tax=Thermofilum pendens (strain DSM 2475 / Hrk 5) TaxID=368408 RepID=A1RW45_THEPD|nr:hypothetical protein [Thermofilum pendens]ABL77425.1 hypothetical protein Tpen_0015 [Thermofilum pendens Hrk 5]
MKVLDARLYGERWTVAYRENDKWQVGIYIPENASLREVTVLEKHDRPELFVLLEGEITLVVSEDGSELREVKMEPGKLYVVDEWHNAYRPGGRRGVALVVEAPGVETEYMEVSPRCNE